MSSSQTSPFSLDSDEVYRQWRVRKLSGYPQQADSLIVDIANPQAISEAESSALLQRIRATNMAVYRTAEGNNPDKAIPRVIASHFGLQSLDSNFLADDDGLSSITVSRDGERPAYIPYTNRPINWHCDGYYNTGEKQIRAMVLHCVQNAAQGGVNELIDHEYLYILLRDENPDYIRAFMAPDVMTIPPGTDADGQERGASVGPVFSVHREDGALHMRYTARKRNIEWKEDSLTREALAYLESLLSDESLAFRYRLLLEPGMGLLCNNVPHTRNAFEDREGAPKRLLYRARYFDRIRNT